LAIYVNL